MFGLIKLFFFAYLGFLALNACVRIGMDANEHYHDIDRAVKTDARHCAEVCTIPGVEARYGHETADRCKRCSDGNYILLKSYLRAVNGFYVCGIDTPCIDVLFRFVGTFGGAMFCLSAVILVWSMRDTILRLVTWGWYRKNLVTVDENWTPNRKSIDLAPKRAVLDRIGDYFD